jgi:hypothetical protein
VVQVIAGALASVSAAIIASTFGVAGTVIGAALTSVTVTIASALYAQSLERAHARVRPRRRQSGDVPHVATGSRPRRGRSLAWGAVAGGAALIFMLAMGGLSAIEMLAKTPVAELMGHLLPGNAQTMVGTMLHGVTNQATSTLNPSSAMPGVAPKPSQTPPPSAPAEPSTQPSQQPVESAPSPSPSPSAEPTSTSHSPTERAAPSPSPEAPMTIPGGSSKDSGAPPRP